MSARQTGTAQDTGLEGIGVLVTRPREQADALCAAIERHGGTAIRFPVLEICDPLDPLPLQNVVPRLAQFDLAIFISANAVNRALGRMLDNRAWPDSLRIAVIGKRSAEELTRFGLSADIQPVDRFDSEALLDLPEMHDVAGRHIVIFRGNGGRELLARTLRERGAEVEYVEAYRRARPEGDAGALLRHWAAGEIDIVVVNSIESLNNLYRMVGDEGRPLLRATQLLVVSERMLPLADELGFREPPVVASNATDQAVLAALLAWNA